MGFDSIPQEMRSYRQWVVWRFEDISAKKPTKVPYSPITGKLASVTNSGSWSSYDDAVYAVEQYNLYDGIGFVLTEDDPYTFIDLDDAAGDEDATKKQQQVYTEFQSFAELSPSGNGLHIIIKGKVPAGRRRSYIEVYSNNRYMTMTGNVFRDAPIVSCNGKLKSLYESMSKGNEAVKLYAGLTEEKEPDDIILKRASEAANGELFIDLYEGRWQDKYNSQSEADFALVDLLAFYTQCKGQIQRIFRASALGQREKALRQDYMNYMLSRCFDHMLPPVDIDGLQNQIEETLAAKKAAAMPTIQEPVEDDNIYSVPPGLVGDIAKFIYEAAPRPVPEIALAGALGMVAGIVGRSYNVSGTGLNQYVLLLAPTGTGKEAISSGVDKLFASVLKTVPAAAEFIGPSEIASAQAVIKYMSKGPKSFVSMVGEFGIYLQQMCSHKASTHQMGLRRFLLDCYNKSGEGKVLRPTIYSDKEKNTASIISPAFSLLGESTPEKFYEGLHEGLISEGLLPRFTVIEYHGDRPALSSTFRTAQPTFELIDKISSLCAHSLMLNNQHRALHVQFTQDAEDLFNGFDKYCDDQINATDREVTRHLWNRAHMKSMKLAAIVAIGINPYNPVIDINTAHWALNIVIADSRNLLKRFYSGEIGRDNDESKQLSLATKIIKKYVLSSWQEVSATAGEGLSNLHQNKIIPFSYLQRKLGALSSFKNDRIGANNALKRVLNTMLERGDLEELSRAVLKKQYGTTARAFMISNVKVFDLEN